MTTDRDALVKLLREVRDVFVGDTISHWQLEPETMLMRGYWIDRINTALTAHGGEQAVHSRDMDWVLAMANALGRDSEFSVPIVPKSEPFKKLFAEIRERQTADTVSVPRDKLSDYARMDAAVQMVAAGALLDFVGFLTSRKETISVGITEFAAPTIKAVTEWATLRSLPLDAAAVLSWQKAIAAAKEEK